MLDIELLDPSFGGLNFNITGSMRAGIFIKDMMDQDTKKEENRLQRGSIPLLVSETYCHLLQVIGSWH